MELCLLGCWIKSKFRGLRICLFCIRSCSTSIELGASIGSTFTLKRNSWLKIHKFNLSSINGFKILFLRLRTELLILFMRMVSFRVPRDIKRIRIFITTMIPAAPLYSFPLHIMFMRTAPNFWPLCQPVLPLSIHKAENPDSEVHRSNY